MDQLLNVVDPSNESILLSERISKLAVQVGKPIHYVLNKVNQETEAFLRNALGEKKKITSIPEDKDIFTSGLQGKELDMSLDGIGEVVDALMKGS